MAIATFEWPAIAGESAGERFHRLAKQWDEESAIISSVTEMVMLPSYQKTIGMGWAAVPFMLEDLKNEPRHWFAALRAITDINPVPLSDAENIKKMADAWVNWDVRILFYATKGSRALVLDKSIRKNQHDAGLVPRQF